MTKRIIAVLVLLPVAIIVVALSLANRQPVELIIPNFDGSALFSASLPLFAVVFVTLFLGLLLGSLGTWLRQARYRRAAETGKVEATKARRDAEKQRQRAEQMSKAEENNSANERAAALGLPAPTPNPKNKAAA
jgi:cell division protein FtsL